MLASLTGLRGAPGHEFEVSGPLPDSWARLARGREIDDRKPECGLALFVIGALINQYPDAVEATRDLRQNHVGA